MREFHNLLNENGKKLLNFGFITLIKRGLNTEDAKDCVQQILFEIYKTYKNRTDMNVKILFGIYKQALNRSCLKFRASKRNQVSVTSIDQMEYFSDTVGAYNKIEFKQATKSFDSFLATIELHDVIKDASYYISNRDLSILILCYIGFSAHEIAKFVDLSPRSIHAIQAKVKHEIKGRNQQLVYPVP